MTDLIYLNFCIGLKFAMLEIKIVLADLLRRFQFSVRDPSVPIKAALELLLTSKDGVHLLVSKRIKVVG